MVYKSVEHGKLERFVNSIELSSMFIVGPEHPFPGEPYCGLFFTSYLPSSPAGQELCNLLRRAFDERLIFTIGRCPATGEENKIVWNGIEMKTSRGGGPAK